MPHELIPLVVIPLLVLGALLLWHWIGPLVISYRLTSTGLEVRVFRSLCVRQVDFSDIADVQEVKWYQSIGLRGTLGLIFRGSWGNRVFVRSFVLIKPKKGLFVMITPKDPCGFVKQAKSLMGAS